MPNVDAAVLRHLVTAVFEAVGAPTDIAAEVAGVLVDNNLAGHDSHGVLRVPQYVHGIRSGQVLPAERPTVLEESPTTALVSGHWGFGQLSSLYAAEVLTRKALSEGVAAVSLVQVWHIGRLGSYTERAAQQGVVMFMFVDAKGGRRTAPYGGAAPALGTNPVAVSLPRQDAPAVTLDIATSAIAAGKVKVAAAAGTPLPEGAVVTRDGLPTTDPAVMDDGGMFLPFGGHKGYALSVVTELLGGALTGSDAYPALAPRSGAFLFGVRADAFRPRADYEQAVDDSVERITSVRPAAGFDEVLVPGQRSARARDQRLRDGVPLAQPTWDALRALAAELGVEGDVPG